MAYGNLVNDYNRTYYNRTFNGHAISQVIRHADIPDPALGVGFAEHLGSMPIKIMQTATVRKPVFGQLNSIDQTAKKTNGEQMHLASFPSTGYMGETLVGW
jgi:hypothetical protein